MGSNEGRSWVSLGGVGHIELSEGFFGLTIPLCQDLILVGIKVCGYCRVLNAPLPPI